MSRWIFALLTVGALSGCGLRQYDAPRDAQNACAILAEFPRYRRALVATERRRGVPVAVQMAIIYQESSFVSNARPPRRWFLGFIPRGRPSTAYGYAQAIDGTWEDYVRREGRRFARRDNIFDAADFMGWYMNDTVRRTGVPLHDVRNQYLAYHEGHAGYRRGSFARKAWLVQTASRVADRAVRYDAQLRTCGH